MTDQLGDVLTEIRNPDLPPQRLEEIARLFNEFDDRSRKVQSWLRFADSNPQFDTVFSRFGKFEVSPVDGFYARLSSAQSIPHNTETTIEFDTSFGDNQSLSFTDVAGKMRINKNHNLYGVIGLVEWATDGTGYRRVAMNNYDADDVNISGLTFHNFVPNGTVVDTFPIAAGITFFGVNNAEYIRLTVKQTSGGALDLNFARAYFFALV